MNGWNHEVPKLSEIRFSEKSEHFPASHVAPVTIQYPYHIELHKARDSPILLFNSDIGTELSQFKEAMGTPKKKFRRLWNQKKVIGGIKVWDVDAKEMRKLGVDGRVDRKGEAEGESIFQPLLFVGLHVIIYMQCECNEIYYAVNSLYSYS